MRSLSLTPKAIRLTVLSSITALLLLTWPAHKYSNQILETAGIKHANDTRSAMTPHSNSTSPVPHDASVPFLKPKGVRVVALVFFGRTDRVSILDCYLERNLPEQGGWLDEVHFVQATSNPEDLNFLQTLVASSPRYKLLQLDPLKLLWDKYSASWDLLERDTIYIKLDDDVVFMADDTIPRIVHRKLEHPEFLAVSANMINNPLMGQVHFENGAVYPYLPAHVSAGNTNALEMKRYRGTKKTGWQLSDYPPWSGPDDYKLEAGAGPSGLSPVWLRMRNQQDILRTPISEVEYDTWGVGLKSWSIAAQSHLSLLENLLHGTTNLYYHNNTDIWATDYRRLSINLLAIDSNEILSHLPVEGVDEEWLTVDLPRRIGKHIAVETAALAAHFSFQYQRDLQYTDILDRYRDYANEKVCLTPQQLGRPILENGGGEQLQEMTITNGSSVFGMGEYEKTKEEKAEAAKAVEAAKVMEAATAVEEAKAVEDTKAVEMATEADARTNIDLGR